MTYADMLEQARTAQPSFWGQPSEAERNSFSNRRNVRPLDAQSGGSGGIGGPREPFLPQNLPTFLGTSFVADMTGVYAMGTAMFYGVPNGSGPDGFETFGPDSDDPSAWDVVFGAGTSSIASDLGPPAQIAQFELYVSPSGASDNFFHIISGDDMPSNDILEIDRSGQTIAFTPVDASQANEPTGYLEDSAGANSTWLPFAIVFQDGAGEVAKLTTGTAASMDNNAYLELQDSIGDTVTLNSNLTSGPALEMIGASATVLIQNSDLDSNNASWMLVGYTDESGNPTQRYFLCTAGI